MDNIILDKNVSFAKVYQSLNVTATLKEHFEKIFLSILAEKVSIAGSMLKKVVVIQIGWRNN